MAEGEVLPNYDQAMANIQPVFNTSSPLQQSEPSPMTTASSAPVNENETKMAPQQQIEIQTIQQQAPPTQTVVVVQQPQPETIVVVMPQQQSTKDKLLICAQDQLQFYDKLHYTHRAIVETQAIPSQDEHIWDNVILDYELFMTAYAKNKSLINIQMPLELEFIWRIHMSYPAIYIADCMRSFGEVLPHPWNNTTLTKQYVSFISNNLRAAIGIDLNNNDMTNIASPGFLNPKFKMKLAMRKQLRFWNDMRLYHRPSMNGQSPLINASKRYYKFMTLLFKQDDKPKKMTMFVPPFDADLMWRSHQLMTMEYYEFCQKYNPMKHVVSYDWYDLKVSRCYESEKYWNKNYGPIDYFAYYGGVCEGINQKLAGMDILDVFVLFMVDLFVYE